MPMMRRGYTGPRLCACGDHAFARATKHGVVLVDPFDADVLSGPWTMNQKGYAERKRLGKLHRFLLNPPADKLVDHRNGDKLDNRRRNLRVCDDAQSLRNRGKCKPGGGAASLFKGVTYQANGWVARVCCGGSRIYLGRYSTEEAAACAYDAAAKQYHGEFARLNFEEAA